MFFNLKKLKSENKYALNSIKREIKELLETQNIIKNKYDNFCIKSIHYLNGENWINDFKKPIENENYPCYQYFNIFKKLELEDIKETIKFINNLTLLSLYFSQYQYLFNLLSNSVFFIFKLFPILIVS